MIKKLIFKLFLIISATTSLFAETASIDIEKSALNLVKIAVESYAMPGVTEFEKTQIDAMFLNDLKVSDRLEAVANPFKNGYDTPVTAAEMQTKGIELLIKYKITKTPNGLSTEYKLFDPQKNAPLMQRFTVSSFTEYPFLSHNMTVSINDYLRAPSIDWMKNFVILAKDMGAKKSDIVIADYTLTYQKTIIHGGYNIFPKWAGNSQKEFYYTAYENEPTLYKYDIYSGKKTRIMSSDGMIMCSDVSADGKKLLITKPSGGLPDVFMYEPILSKLTNLTRYSGIDVNGNFIENDTKIAFVSDRLGYPTVFTKALNSDNVEQLIFSPRYNSSFNAQGELLTYVAREGGEANLYLMNTKSGQKRQITFAGYNSSPRLSKAGDAIMFFKNDHRKTYLGIFRLNSFSVYLFPMNIGRIKSLDW